ncbi:MAG TPA: spore coat protein U domain-containing protein [Casimicrobiaceae bacterium]|nr:spore coat protein U domain-containing protein [Casimicrobiaceae bacterium]
MNRNLTKSLVAGALAAFASVASAGGTHIITVSASVTGVCKIIDATSTLAFGTLDPASGGTVNAVWSGGKFSCSKGQAFTVSSDDGLWESSSGGANNRMKLSTATDCTVASNCIRYTLTSVASGTGAGHGVGNEISFNVTGQTLIADYQNANVGTYGDTVTLTVSP